MALATADVVRFSIRQLRQGFTAREFRKLRAVALEVDGLGVEVGLVSTAAPTARSGYRRYLRCPSCSDLCLVVGLDVASRRWGCRTCLRWRARKLPRVS